MAINELYEAMGLTRIVAIDADGRACLEYQAKPQQCHSGGVVQGGFVTGWIDAAMAHAVIARVGENVVPMTLELKVSFLAPARPGAIFAEGWIIKAGRKTAFAEGSLKDADGNLLATASSTLMLADRGRVESAAKAAMENTQ
ncbi:MAG: PaaI family thioesterase [Novosphingobium sp.]|uniref:PaaI family thioesterase n=1 Tax=Novosphingobium sp. TaxID=1874826 RepID=UPI0032BBE983